MLKERIQEAIKAAMRAKEKHRLTTLRMLTAAIKQREVDERTTLDETEILAVINKMVKQRQDAIAQYQKANRDDLVKQESAEISILQEFLPEPLNENELKDLIGAAISESQATTMADMGKVMAILRPQIQGRADMGKASQLVKQQLS